MWVERKLKCNEVASSLTYACRRKIGFAFVVIFMCTAWLGLAPAANGAALNTLYSFGNATSVYNDAFLVALDGILYGAAGTNLLKVQTNGLVTFVGLNSGSVSGPLTQRTYDGNLYGVDPAGQFDDGEFFEVTTNGAFSILGLFTGANGNSSRGRLLEGSDGNFYGTTYQGGTNGGYGTIFSVTFNGRITSLHSFSNGNEGAYPVAGLTLGPDGCFYGTTTLGGPNNAGTIFRLCPNGVFSTLYSFTGGKDGYFPRGGLVKGDDGSLYGTTTYGGNYDTQFGGDGTVFKITANGVFTSLAAFNFTNGALPQNGLVKATDGYFYGTARSGGFAPNSVSGTGTIFRISPAGGLTNLYTFGSVPTTNNVFLDGYAPVASLVQAQDGNFYGMTTSGGPNGFGTIFQFTPPAAAPVLRLLGYDGSSATFGWRGNSGQAFQVQFKTNLNQPDWEVLIGSTAATNFSDTTGDKQRFYRVLVQGP
jgi:uncharacterized repeat protein (TIGR03803 family)